MSNLNHAIICIITLYQVSIFTGHLTSVRCDLQQKGDSPSTQEVDASPDDKGHQLADPDYIKHELKDLIKMKIDTDHDGYVSYEELKNYIGVLHDRNVEYNVDKQWQVYSPQIHEVFSWEGYEPEKKEILTWDHYFNQTYPELIGVDIGIPINREQDTSRLSVSPDEPQSSSDESDKKTDLNLEPQDENLRSLKLMVQRADTRWKLADENGDTLLTKEEFKFLLHPDEGHEGLKNLFVQEATEDMDMNKDGKICLDEFMKHLQILATEQERNDQGWLSSQQENFGRFLDKNKDGVLDSDEISNWLVPARSKKFDIEAKRLMDVGDANDDNKLSNVEIMEHYDQYLSLLPPEYWRNAQDTNESDQHTSSEELHEEL